jgi:hypothetical protein
MKKVFLLSIFNVSLPAVFTAIYFCQFILNCIVAWLSRYPLRALFRPSSTQPSYLAFLSLNCSPNRSLSLVPRYQLLYPLFSSSFHSFHLLYILYSSSLPLQISHLISSLSSLPFSSSSLSRL